MSQEEYRQIIRDAIEKAIANGWKALKIGDIKRWSTWKPDEKEAIIRMLVGKKDYNEGYKMVIFDHDFAKALWGQPMKAGVFNIEGWQEHLIAMVIAEDPLKYLRDNM